MTDVVHERYIEAAPSLVFAMFTEPAEMSRWLGDAAELDPRPGGLFRFTIADDACRGVYLEVDPPWRVVFTWGWERAEAIPVPAGSTTVEVDLIPEGDGTRLRLVHRGLETDRDILLHDHGWSRFLRRLDAVAKGEEPPDDPGAETPEEVLGRIAEGG